MVDLRKENNVKEAQFKLTLCDGPTCIHKQSKQIHQALDTELKKHNLLQDVSIHLSGCLGMCKKGPILIVNPGYIMYGQVKVEDIAEIVQSHLVEGNPVSRLIINEDHLYNRFFRIFGDVDFFGKQMRITLRNCGIIDPENIDDYLSVRGYEALAKVLTDMTPAGRHRRSQKSGLRGRGGAGFPTGLKWEFTAAQRPTKNT
jgi:(2Fe-2S) ferredoxin